MLIGKNITSVAARGDVLVVAVNTSSPFSLTDTGIFRSADGVRHFFPRVRGSG